MKKTMPEYCTEEMLKFLDELRESGITNMFGAGPYVEDHFGLDRKTGKDVLVYWMETFTERYELNKS